MKYLVGTLELVASYRVIADIAAYFETDIYSLFVEIKSHMAAIVRHDKVRKPYLIRDEIVAYKLRMLSYGMIIVEHGMSMCTLLFS